MKQIILCIVLMLSSYTLFSQNVVKQGNTFTIVNSSKLNASSKETKTEFVFTDSKGVTYPIYLSSTGKAFIYKTSKKTGKQYKQYLPEIGKQINPSAYKDNK